MGVCVSSNPHSALWPAAVDSADTALQLETPVVHAVSEKSPSSGLVPPAGYVILTVVMRRDLRLLPCSLIVFVLLKPHVHHWDRLKWATSNTTSAQVDRFHRRAPFFTHTHTVADAHKQRRGYWMGQLPRRLRHVAIMRKTGRFHQSAQCWQRTRSMHIKDAACLLVLFCFFLAQPPQYHCLCLLTLPWLLTTHWLAPG